MDRKNIEEMDFLKYALFILLFSIILLLAPFMFYLLFYKNPTKTFLENSALSATAFAGFIGTIFVFVNTLLLYKTLQGQNKNNENQQNQQFENNFFQLLNINDKLKRQYLYSDRKNLKEILKIIESNFEQEFPRYFKDETFFHLHKKESIQIYIDDKFDELFSDNNYQLGHFFRNLYHIIKFIDSSVLHIEKKRYTDILQSQLTDDELALILYNSLTQHSTKYYLYTLDNLSFFENLGGRNGVLNIIKRDYFPMTKFKYYFGT